MDYYIEVDGKPVPVDDSLTWAKAFETMNRRVMRSEITDTVWVSTVFLGLNHNLTGLGPPLLYETMIFGGRYHDWQDRYATRQQAEAAHLRIARNMRRGKGPDD